MVVAKWEFRALANMLLATHGADAEQVAKARMERASAEGDRGEAVVWSEVLDRLPELMSQKRIPDGHGGPGPG